MVGRVADDLYLQVAAARGLGQCHGLLQIFAGLLHLAKVLQHIGTEVEGLADHHRVVQLAAQGQHLLVVFEGAGIVVGALEHRPDVVQQVGIVGIAILAPS